MLKRLLSAALVGAMLASSAMTLSAGAEGSPQYTSSDVDDLFASADAGNLNVDMDLPTQTAAPSAAQATAEPDQEGQTAADIGVQAQASGYATLQLGDQDGDDSAAIVFLQNRLIELEYLMDEADGYYGENTETAVREFQRSNGLQPTGVADPQTQVKLFSDISTLVKASVDTTLYGGETSRVQTVLAQWGFLGSRVDGRYGNETAQAIRQFKLYMVDIDPDFGATPTPVPTVTPEPYTIFGEMPAAPDEVLPLTVEQSLDGEIDDALMAYVDGRKPFEVYHHTVRNGDTGRDVKRVQTRLRQLGYLYKADGSFGDNTALALKYFQRKSGLNETGVADEATQRALFSGSAAPAEEYVFPYKIVVSIEKQRVYVGAWTGEAYTKLVKTMKCSTGTVANPTPTGTYQSGGRASDEWYFFKQYNCYAKWATRIVGGILFHSITYNTSFRKTGNEKNLGHRASHGCVRLTVDDAKWIWDNCPLGTTIVITED